MRLPRLHGNQRKVGYCLLLALYTQYIFMKLYDKTNVIDIMNPNLLTLQ